MNGNKEYEMVFVCTLLSTHVSVCMFARNFYSDDYVIDGSKRNVIR